MHMNDRSCRLCRPLPVFVRVRSFDANGHSDHNVHSEPNLFKRLHIQEFIKSRDGGDSSPVHSRLNLPASQADSFVSTTIRFWQVSLRRCASSSRQSIKQPKQNAQAHWQDPVKEGCNNLLNGWLMHFPMRATSDLINIKTSLPVSLQRHASLLT